MSTDKRSAYMEKLRDPRWQKMRLEIMQRDDWECKRCKNREQTLNVHHRWYESGKEPWDYPADALVTLCEDCHLDETELRQITEQRLIQVFKKVLFRVDLMALACGFEELPPVLASELCRGMLGHEERVIDFLRQLNRPQ